MADSSDLSLLFRIRGDAAGAKQATAETRAAVAQLRTSLGSEFNQIQSAGQKALSGIGDNLNTFVGARIPLIGGAFLRVTDNLKGVGTETKKVDADIAKFSKTIDGLSSTTGKSKSELINFLTSFVQLESQAKRDTSAIETFGAATAQTLIPELEKAGGELSAVATNAGAAGSSIGAAVPIIGLAAVALIALSLAAASVVKQFLELTVSTADWQGKLHDTSLQTEISVETLSGLEVALRKTGGSLDSATNALITFQTKLADAQDPTSNAAAQFEALGITATDTETAFRQALLAVAAMPDGFEKVNTAAELFGRRGAKQLLAAIKETDGDLDKLIRQLKATGVLLESDVAKAADEFNDQLLVVQLQIRALTAELVTNAIPQILAALRATSKIIAENREGIEIIGNAIGLFVRGNVYGILLPALKATDLAVKSIEKAWRGVQFAALVAAGASVESARATVRAAEEAANRISPLDTGGEVESGLGGDVTQRREFRESQERLKQAKFEADEQARISRDAIAQAERDFQDGKRTRAQRTADVIANLKKETEARLAALQAEEKTKQLEQAAREGDVVAQRKIAEDIDKIRQESRNLQSEANNKIKEEEQKAQQERAKDTIDHLNNLIGLRRKHAENEIAIEEARIKAHEITEEEGARRIAIIQNRVFAERRKILNDQLAAATFGGLSQEQRDQIIQQRKELNLEIARAEQEQAERLKEIRRKDAEDERNLLLQRLDNTLRLGAIRDNAQIASLRAHAALRIKTEEETERAVLAIRLAAIDREKGALEARRTAAGSILDPKARRAEEERINADLRTLQAEREAIQAEGDRNLDEGRRKDIENRRRYAAEIRAVDNDIRRGELEQRRRDLEQIAQREGLNAKTIALFRKLTLDEEAEHHRRVLGEINAQERQAHAVDVGGKNRLEIEQKYNQLREQENERFQKRNTEINKPGGADVSGSPSVTGFGSLMAGISGQVVDGIKQMEDGTVRLEGVATSAFNSIGLVVNGLAQGVGSLVQQWVLMGDQADISMQKVLASVLASVSAQAAVQAIMFLAYGIAALTPWGAAIYGPAPPWFQAAALMGGIALGAGLAGRAVAGGSFQNKPAGGGGSSQGNTGGSSAASKPTTIKEEWRQLKPQVIILRVESNDSHVLKVVQDEFDIGGRTARFIVEKGERFK